jgi:uncharacterized protein (TIGR03085 family)
VIAGMGDRTLAAAERHELCTLMEQLGPDAPTLCEGWTTRDLAAHLVIREGRPGAAAGILLPPLAPLTARVQRSTAERPWPELLAMVRNGPPWWSLMRLGPLGEKINGIEFFVHHEDVRRIGRGWVQRPADSYRAGALWTVLSQLARLCYRHSPVGVVLRRSDSRPDGGSDGTELVARRGRRSVTVVGPPEELTLHAYGRAEAMVDIDGDSMDVQRLQDSRRGF